MINYRIFLCTDQGIEGTFDYTYFASYASSIGRVENHEGFKRTLSADKYNHHLSLSLNKVFFWQDTSNEQV